MVAIATLTLQQARCLQLAAQGLLAPPARAATPAALRRCIARMQLLQIDTIHVVARSPYLVLHSRLGDYPMRWLDQALEHAQIFETWAHEACFAVAQDLGMHRAYNAAARRHWGLARGQRLHDEERQQLDRLLQHVRDSGAVKSSDFERKDERASAWWGWKDEKLWLEALFARGELMVARRENFQRVYDLPERVVPELQSQVLPSAQAAGAQFVEKAVAALGVTQARWINDYFRTKPRLQDADLDEAVAQGRLLRVAVQGWPVPGYVHSANRALLRKALRDELQATHTCLLSPFDPLVWDRAHPVWLRLHAGVLHARGETAVWLLRAAVAAPRRNRRTARRQGAPRGRRVRSQGAVPGARRATWRRWHRCAGAGPARQRCLARHSPGAHGAHAAGRAARATEQGAARGMNGLCVRGRCVILAAMVPRSFSVLPLALESAAAP